MSVDKNEHAICTKLTDHPDWERWRTSLRAGASSARIGCSGHEQAERPDVVVLARDEDNKPERQRGLTQAIEANEWPFEIISASAVTEIEAWFVAGFEPADEHEREALERFEKAEGFDPRQESHRLVGQTPRDAKQLLGVLTKDDRERRLACLESDLALLEARGAANGLRDFIKAVRDVVVPKFAAGPPPV